MTLPSIPFLWKQFNGPQIVGITRGIFNFIKSRFDSWMSYFWDFSIGTMNSEHLTTTGSLISFARPTISMFPENWFRYATMVTTPTGYGFDDGFLTVINPESMVEYKGPIPAEMFRTLLIAFTRDDYSFLSLKMLDDIMYTLRERYGTATEDYTISWVDRENVPVLRHVGDIEINIGRRDMWRQATLIYQTLVGLRDNVFTPEPVLYFDVTQPTNEQPSEGSGR